MYEENAMKESATPKVVSRDEWERARAELLVREKEHTRAGDELAAARRRLPMASPDDADGTGHDRRFGWPGPPSRCVRRPAHVDRVSLHVEPGRASRKTM